MICPVCGIHEAQRHITYGVLPCPVCQDRRGGQPAPNHPVEFTTQEIKDGRKEYLKSIIQPWRSGQLSKEYIDLHGTKGITATEAEIAQAKPVWTDLPNMENLGKTR